MVPGRQPRPFAERPRLGVVIVRTLAAVLAVVLMAQLAPSQSAGAATTASRTASRAARPSCLQRAARLKTATARAAARRSCSTTTTRVAVDPVPVTTMTSAPQGASGSGTVPIVGGCSMFPPDNAWNQPVDGLPLHPSSATWVATLGLARTLHPDFGGPYGIPFTVVPATQAPVPITFTAYGAESDPGPYPIPVTSPIEGGSGSDGDRHVLVLQSGACKLYELYRAFPAGTGWKADSGAVFDLNSNRLRAEGWTSADAAGLPVTAGLVRYEDIADGALRHAVRFTANCTQRAYVHPATHQAGRDDPSCPPMGARYRMKASFDLSPYTGQTRIILEGLKRYGMIVADNGSNWFITGAVDARWNVDDLEQLKRVPGSAFEAVDTGPLQR